MSLLTLLQWKEGKGICLATGLLQPACCHGAGDTSAVLAYEVLDFIFAL